MKKVVFAILALTLSAACASAQITTYRSSSTTVALKATVAEYASITVANPIVNFSITDPTQTTNGDNTVSITANYSYKNGASFAVCVASNIFATPGLAGTGTNTDVIPMAAIEVQPMATGPYISLSGATDDCGLPNGVNIIAKTAVVSGSNKGTATGSFNLAIAPVTVRPDVYSGTVLVYLQEL